MNKKFMYSFAFLFAFALVSAGVVSFLSNEVTATVEITSPLALLISSSGWSDSWAGSTSLDSMTAGDVITLYTKEIKYADGTVPSEVVITITDKAGTSMIGNMSCEMLTSLNAYVKNGDTYSTTPFDLTDEDGPVTCDVIDSSIVYSYHKDVTEDELLFRIEAVTAFNMVGNYDIAMQFIPQN